MKRIATNPPTDEAGLTRKLAALSHPVRLELVRCLGERDACCVKELVNRVDLAQSTVSQHLKVLLEAGLVRYQPERQSSRYSLDTAALASVAVSLELIIGQICGGCCGAGGKAEQAGEPLEANTG